MRSVLVSVLFFLLPASAAGQDAPILVVVERAPAVEAPVEPEELASEAFEVGWVGLGLSMLVGTRPSGDGLAPTFLGGIDLSFRVDPLIAVGLRRVYFGSFGSTSEWTVGASPFLEITFAPWERVDLYGQFGAALDVSIGRGGVQNDGIGVAAFGGTGARFYLDELFSLAVEGAVHVPVLNGLSLGEALAPPLSVAFQGGAALSFHFR